MCTINKSAYTKKKSGNLFNEPCIFDIYDLVVLGFKAYQPL